MITEIYKIEPTDGSDIQQLAKDGENLQLREELGLDPLPLKEDNADFFRFRKMTQEEGNVYDVLFPEKTSISLYREFIPNDILQALVEFKNTCPFYHIQEAKVWHAKDYDPDPILTVSCRTEKDDYSFVNATYIIGRWGEALESFATLQAKAFKQWKEKRITQLSDIIEEAQLALRKAEKAQSIGKTGSPSFYE